MSAIELSVITNPNITAYYPPSTQLATFSTVAANNVVAYKDEFSTSMSLVIGATSNIEIEAIENINAYMQNGSLNLFKSSWSNDVREDTLFLNIDTDEDATYINSINKLQFYANDPEFTYSLGDFSITSSNNYTSLHTDQINGFLFKSRVTLEDPLLVKDDVVMGSNLYVFGNIIGDNMAMFRDFDNSNEMPSRVGYGFRINDNGQLELIKYAKFNDANVDIMKRIAIFGNKNFNESDLTDPGADDYNAFRDLENVSFSNGSTRDVMPKYDMSVFNDIEDYEPIVVQTTRTSVQPIVISELDSVELTNDSAMYNLTYNFNDINNPQLHITYSLDANPYLSATIHSNGALEVKGAWRNTSYTVVVRATNSDNLSTTSSLLVKEAGIQTPIVKREIGTLVLLNDTIYYNLNQIFKDPQWLPLTYTLSMNPHLNASISNDTLTVVGAYRNTSYSIIVRATNASGLFVESTLSVIEEAPAKL